MPFVSVHPPLIWDPAVVSAAGAKGFQASLSGSYPRGCRGVAVPEGSHDPCGQFVGGSAGTPPQLDVGQTTGVFPPDT